MSLNIKNERVHELAREAARVTGKSQTSAIEEGLRLLLAQRGADPDASARAARIERLLAIGERYRQEEVVPPGGIASVDDLYDAATGLPR
ncbi:type II toxin-antitoxin system VapB family antitoxin [Microbacterium sp.]|uniref:type II toxin-antitoxin system VapB family antitoxin n=1 Tax=Microbacterium sp. TaxID=51671 RepID=UPI0039E24A15